jgi:RNA polymerase sigma factor (sigma-70 family)
MKNDDLLHIKDLLQHIKGIMRAIGFYYKIPSHDRDSIINDVFIKITNKMNNGDIPNTIEEAKDYIFITTRNQIYLYYRQKKRHKKMVFVESYNDDIGYTMDEEFKTSENRNKVDKLISQLPLEIDRIIMKQKLEGYSVNEIAEFNNLTERDVARYYRFAKEYLKKINSNDTMRLRYCYDIVDINTDEVVETIITQDEIKKRFKITRTTLREVLANNQTLDGRFYIKTKIYRKKLL